MKRIIIAVCVAFLSSAAFAQETETKTSGKKTIKDKSVTEKEMMNEEGQKDKMEVSQDKKVEVKDKGDVIDKKETTRQVKRTVKHKQPQVKGGNMPEEENMNQQDKK
jgi:hypothetical protein